MDQPLTKVYFVPGLAAGPEIFERIHLPDDKYEVEILEWWGPSDITYRGDPTPPKAAETTKD